MRLKRAIELMLVLGVLVGLTPVGRAADTGQTPIELTPPRLAFVDGQVSFWRAGAPGWAAAQVNTPLAPGDQLYTGSPGNLELQIGARSFVRAWADSQLGLANQEPDFLQFTVTQGHVSLDLRALDPGQTVELDTPNAAFAIDRAGYYRVDVTPERTSFITRRGGRATVTPANGQAAGIAPSEEVVVEGATNPTVQTYVAPDLDPWDRWNYARTDQLIDSVSSRYMSPGIYGIDDLDHYGAWRVVANYGSVWVPEGVPVGWVPYSTGRWIWDPIYGWTWVDTAPWGWAPFHYGRWVFVDGFWAWAPGPAVVTPVYAPALVVFFGEGVPVASAGPVIGWVALGWGEPLIPWWGPAGVFGVPSWAGWGGPRVVNNVVINRTTVVNVTNVSIYDNVRVRNAVVAVQRDRFGRDAIAAVQPVSVDPQHLTPVRGRLPVTPVAASLAPATTRGLRPPETLLRRTVVATRAPEDPAPRLRAEGIAPAAPVTTPPTRLVSVPPEPHPALNSPRPPFGSSSVERPRGPLPPRFGSPRPGAPTPSSATPRTPAEARVTPGVESPPPAPAPTAPRVTPPPPSHAAGPPATRPAPTPPAPLPGVKPEARSERPQPPHPPVAAAPQVASPRSEIRQPPGRALPGEPANRVFPGRVENGPESGPPRSAARSPVAPQGPAPSQPHANGQPGTQPGGRAPAGAAAPPKPAVPPGQ